MTYEHARDFNNSFNLRLQYTFRPAIFFKFGFMGQSSGRRSISKFKKIY